MNDHPRETTEKQKDSYTQQKERQRKVLSEFVRGAVDIAGLDMFDQAGDDGIEEARENKENNEIADENFLTKTQIIPT